MNTNVELDTYLQDQLRQNAHWYLALGVSLIVLGVLAVIFATTSTLFSVVYLGVMLMGLGVFEGIHAAKVSRWGNALLHGALALLYIVGGIFMMMNPASNALSLTLLLAAFFVVSGASKIFFAATKQVPHQGALAVNGVISCILGVMIWYQWPSSGLWVLGTFLGFEALFTGCTLSMLAYKAKRLKEDKEL